MNHTLPDNTISAAPPQTSARVWLLRAIQILAVACAFLLILPYLLSPLYRVVDCVEGARVRLIKSGAVVAETTSDNYGDFKFDKLDENSGAYTVEIEAKGRATKSIETQLGVSVNLGEIRL